jgi:hypothetical protein
MTIEEAKEKSGLLSKDKKAEAIQNLMGSDGWAILLCELDTRMKRFNSTMGSTLVDEKNWIQIQQIQLQCREAKYMTGLPKMLLEGLRKNNENFDLAREEPTKE